MQVNENLNNLTNFGKHCDFNLVLNIVGLSQLHNLLYNVFVINNNLPSLMVET